MQLLPCNTQLGLGRENCLKRGDTPHAAVRAGSPRPQPNINEPTVTGIRTDRCGSERRRKTLAVPDNWSLH